MFSAKSYIELPFVMVEEFVKLKLCNNNYVSEKYTGRYAAAICINFNNFIECEKLGVTLHDLFIIILKDLA